LLKILQFVLTKLVSGTRRGHEQCWVIKGCFPTTYIGDTRCCQNVGRGTSAARTWDVGPPIIWSGSTNTCADGMYGYAQRFGRFRVVEECEHTVETPKTYTPKTYISPKTYTNLLSKRIFSPSSLFPPLRMVTTLKYNNTGTSAGANVVKW